MHKFSSTLMGIGMVVFGGTAFAQATDPATTGTGTATGTGTVNGGVTATTTVNTPPTTTQSTTTTTQTTAPKADDGERDHEKVAGHLGVGYLGINNIPIAGNPGTIQAPIVGVRYWLDPKLGIDVGLGFGLSGGSAEAVQGANTVSTDKAGRLGMAFHGGVPIALAGSKHFTFEVIPEANFGFATSTLKGQNGGPDTDLSGVMFSLGGRVGAEIQFGFIDIPELALQGSVGLYMQYMSTKSSTNINGSDQSTSNTDWSLSTVTFSDPWAIFTNNISALYYF